MTTHNPILHFAGCVVCKGEKVLLVQEAHPEAHGYWSFPVGKVEKDETSAEAAVRETREETGYVVCIDGAENQVILPNSRFKSIRQYNKVTIHLSVFPAHVKSGKLQTGADVLDVRWFEVETLPSLPLRGEFVREIIQAIFSHHHAQPRS